MKRGTKGNGLLRVGIDAGGTFTDFITSDGRVIKRPSFGVEAGNVLLDGVRELIEEDVPVKDIDLVHGTTVGTNALLTDSGARIGLLITHGFADLLQLGRQTRPDLFDLQPTPLWTPPDRRLIAEVRERMDAQGRPLKAPDMEAVRSSAEGLVKRGAESLAVCFLHSYRNPSHERSVAGALRGVGVPVTISSDLTLEMREFERFSTAFANAGLRPLMQSYLSHIARRLRVLSREMKGDCRLTIMQSSGGLIGSSEAKKEPVRLVLSGPAGGVLAAFGRRGRRRRLVTLDMGGTSTDVCLLNGELPAVPSSNLKGRPLSIPAIDIHTVGAGGGSIARANSSGVLEVGPSSAGANPGPACYGKGGPVTVTDANVFLNRIPEGFFLGGSQTLDREQSTRSLNDLGDSLGLTAEESALGIIAIAEAAMARALRTISLERGHDPRRFSLMAFGGAGPLHAASLCDAMGLAEVLVPPNPGAFSAEGLLRARPTRELASCVLGRSLESVMLKPEPAFAGLERKAVRALGADGVDADDVIVERFVDLRYQGQSSELTLSLRSHGMASVFTRAHRDRFGFELEATQVELVNLRVRVHGPSPPARLRGRRVRRGQSRASGSVQVGFEDGRHEAALLKREQLSSEDSVAGPAIIVEYSSTTLVPPGFLVRAEPGGMLCLSRKSHACEESQ